MTEKKPKLFRLADQEAEEYGQPPAWDPKGIIEEMDNGRKIPRVKGVGAQV